MSNPIDDAALRQVFLDARTHNKWEPRDVPDSVLQQLVQLLIMAPTSANCSPARLVFVKSKDAKERLKPHLSEGNRDKTMEAPVCAIVGYDMEFYEHLPKLFPHTDARSWFAGKPEKIQETAFRNGTLQGGYLILAARALGLDCGPMSGFDNDGVDKEFFAGTSIRSNFLCNLGYGNPTGVRPRSPRFEFQELAKVI
jgi:3-hydroxypropanoate dehydrogenase